VEHNADEQKEYPSPEQLLLDMIRIYLHVINYIAGASAVCAKLEIIG
jgi:hypothetical protein